MRGRLRAFPHALPLPAPQRDGVSPHSLPPCPPVQRVPLPSGKSRHFTLSLRRVYVAAISDVQATQRSGGPLSVIWGRARQRQTSGQTRTWNPRLTVPPRSGRGAIYAPRSAQGCLNPRKCNVTPPRSRRRQLGQSTHEVLVHEAGHALGIYGGFDDVEGNSRGHPILVESQEVV